MAPKEYVNRQFNSYQIHYAITRTQGEDCVRIDFFNGGTKVGQILMGDSITPGSYANLNGDEINLYFPLFHFDNILKILRQGSDLALYLKYVSAPMTPEMAETLENAEDRPEIIREGGIVTNH